MLKKSETAPGGGSARTASSEASFTGFFFKVPSEIDRLMQLTHAELKVYLVVSHAIQRDHNGGLLAISQIAKRSNLSERHARKAAESLCRRRWLIRVNRVTGAELTRKEDWNGRTVTYANPIQWKQKDTCSPSPTGQRSGPEDEKRNALRNGVMESQPPESDPGPLGGGNLRPVGQRHSESSESLECRDSKHAQPEVEPSAFSVLSFERSDGHKLINGFASAKSAEDSPGVPMCAVETSKTQSRKADGASPTDALLGSKPPVKAKTQTPTPCAAIAIEVTSEGQGEFDPELEIEEVLSQFDPYELEDWDGPGVPAWVPYAVLAAAPGITAEVVCEFLEHKAAAGWRPRKWTAIVAVVRDQFTPRPKSAHGKPWTGLDVSNLQKWLSAFMDGEEAPANLVRWITEFAAEASISAEDVRTALETAWRRHAAPGQPNAPRSWNWFYEVLRAAFIPGYAARLPEEPAAPHPAHQTTPVEMAVGIDALDALVASYRCKCGAEIRQYADRVDGTCVCGPAKPITRVGQMPVPGNRRAAAGGR